MLNFIKKYYVPLILLILFIITSIFLKLGIFDSIDKSIMNKIYELRGNKYNGVYWVFRITTELGFYYFLIAFLLILAICFRFRKRIWVIIGTVLVNLGINSILKIIFKRERPMAEYMWMSESSYSYPSGHTATSICVYLIILLITINTVNNKKARIALIILSTFSMIIVPISRLVMGVHYPSDVLAGFLIGSFSATLSYKIFIEK